MMIIDKQLEASATNKVYSESSFYVFFAIQFFLVAAGMFVNVKVGVTTLMLAVIMAFVILGRCSSQGFDMSHTKIGMMYIYIFMGIFCIAALGHPNNVQEAWIISIPHYLVYSLM